jgi:GNAT superfamily N-acetyltransferase
MNPGYPVFENLKSMLEIMGGFPYSRYLDEYPALTLYDGGVDDAYENYALFDPRHNLSEKFPEEFEKSAKRGLDFFSRAGRPCVCPLFGRLRDKAGDILEKLGAKRCADFFAMSADIAGAGRLQTGENFKTDGPLRGEREVLEWAQSAWLGFDSDEAAPESFVRFAREMSRREEFSLFHITGHATGMLFAGRETCGIYYVSVLPEFRGRGFGNAIMSALETRAARLGFRKATLLATPSGRPLYLKHGFTTLETVKMYRLG